MGLSIVAPIYNSKPHLVEMFERMFLEGVIRHAPEDTEIILVDDASPLRAETEACVKRLEAIRNVRFVRNSKNLGYPKSCNVGMRLVSKDMMLLSNTDVRLTKGAIDSLITILERNPDVGLVAPVTNNAFGFIAQKVEGFPGIEAYSETEFGKIDRYAADVARALDGFVEVPYLLDFCCLFRTELFEKIGFYDENFGLGYGEENDYGLRVLAAGYRLLVHRAVFVFHGGIGNPDSWGFSSQSMNTRALKAFYYKIKNAYYLRKKYGDDVLNYHWARYKDLKNPAVPFSG